MDMTNYEETSASVLSVGTSDVTGQKTKSKYRRSSMPISERKTAWLDGKTCFQTDPGEDFLIETMIFCRTDHKPKVLGKDMRQEEKGKIKIVDNSEEANYFMQGGKACNPFRRRVERRSDYLGNIKMKYHVPSLKFKETEFAKADSKSSAIQSGKECPDPSQFCSERKSDDDEERSLSELRSMVESQNEVNYFPSGDSELIYMRKTKSSGDLLEKSREIGKIHKNGPQKKLKNKDSILHRQGDISNQELSFIRNQSRRKGRNKVPNLKDENSNRTPNIPQVRTGLDKMNKFDTNKNRPLQQKHFQSVQKCFGSSDKNENVNDINGQDVTIRKKTSATDSKLKGVNDIKSKKTKGVSASNEKKRKQDYTNINQKVKMNPKSVKSKPSLLCVSFCDEAEVGSNMGEYLKHRLGNAFRYNISVESIENVTEKGQSNTKVTLSFPSKAAGTKARNLLRESNKKSTTKLLTYFPEEKERELIVMNSSETEFRFEQHLEIMLNQATQYLELHESKIKEKSAAFKKLERKYKSGKLALKEFESTKAEMKAIEDKCHELELQKNEFGSYIHSVHTQLEGIKYCVKFETKINEIRTAFGIECRRLSNALPIYSRKSDILDAVINSQVCVILGETGSGKSTQIAQYLYQAGLGKNGIIGCTQPRKIAAVTLAIYVASEMASSVGQVVGYHVGMKVKRTNVTKILYMTDQILLNECLKDEELRDFSCIIIDEAHERSVFTDLLLGMIKSALKRRSDLKLVITSATINPDVFVSYFGGPDRCPVVRVSGRTFPVEVIWLNPLDDQNPFEDYVSLAINTAFNIHNQNPPGDGDILVFVTTSRETQRCCEEFARRCPVDKSFLCLPLHGRLQPEEQHKVFHQNPPNRRKIVFATNCAETSITIPEVRFVVDTGLAKEMRLDPKRNVSSLSVYPISQSSAEQRKGRAGRTAPGKCYRLYNSKTYESMEQVSKPEILRVHLGQALLKLLELGVDPLAFDFIESPKQEALVNAMQTLYDIGAADGNKITDLGRWISKLPIEPRQGLLVKKGIQEGIPMEALVVASFNGGSGVFFRSGTQEQIKKADLKKVEFSHTGGDILTLLNVYRKWNKIPEKQKGNWCFVNYVNAKSMKAVRETVNELRTILKTDKKEDILFEFKPMEEADQILKKILVNIFKQNVCCFLGHEKAGFFNLKNHQHVQLHPSSVLKPLDLNPELIVYEQILQTYTDFVTNVTPVDETEKMELPSHVLQTYKSTMESMRVSLVRSYWAGKKVNKQFIGPLHQNRREAEETLSEACENRTVVIDANRVTGEIQLYCCKEDELHTVKILEGMLSELRNPLLQESVELSIGNSDECVRVVLGAGGEIINVLMSHQYRTIVVKQRLLSDKDVEVSEIEEIFSPYGEIVQIKPFSKKNKKNTSTWGIVTFRQDTDAMNAVDLFPSTANKFFEAVPFQPKTSLIASKNFNIQLTWWRRPAKGFAYVRMVSPEDVVQTMAAKSVIIDGRSVLIQQAKSNDSHDTTNQLYLKSLQHDITEDMIKDALAILLGLSEVQADERIGKIVVPRKDAEVSEMMYNSLYRKVEQEVLEYVPRGSFDIRFVPDPMKNQKCIRYSVLVSFNNPEEGQTALKGMQRNPPNFGSYPVYVSAELETSVAIRKNVYEAIRSDIETAIESTISPFPNVQVRTKESKGGNVYINVQTDNITALARVKALLHDIIRGDVLECGERKEIGRLFTRDGRIRTEKIERKTGTIIYIDNRTMSVSVQGTEAKRVQAISDINMYLEELAGLIEKKIHLKGSGKPRGLMKGIISKYGTDMKHIKEDTGIKSLQLDLKNHVINVLGDEVSVGKVEHLIQDVCDSLGDGPHHEASGMPDCPVCLCPVELSDVYHNEYCGHPYCGECIKNHLKFAIQDKNFPIVCIAENCEQPLVMEDFTALIRQGCTTQRDLMKSALCCFVGKNKAEFRYCITPDCDMVYRVTANGTPFTCSECQEKICTACHVQYHNGLTCSMYQAEKRPENQIDSWMEKDRARRKLCPRCSVPIEKYDGCNHMKCRICRIHLCWVCMQSFETKTKCYNHLSKDHGGFF